MGYASQQGQRLRHTSVRTVPYFPVTPTLRVRFVCERPRQRVIVWNIRFMLTILGSLAGVVRVDEVLVQLTSHCRKLPVNCTAIQPQAMIALYGLDEPILQPSRGIHPCTMSDSYNLI